MEVDSEGHTKGDLYSRNVSRAHVETCERLYIIFLTSHMSLCIHFTYVFSVACLQADQKSVAINQIELDLYRTLPTHKHYKADGEWVCDFATDVVRHFVL